MVVKDVATANNLTTRHWGKTLIKLFWFDKSSTILLRSGGATSIGSYLFYWFNFFILFQQTVILLMLARWDYFFQVSSWNAFFQFQFQAKQLPKLICQVNSYPITKLVKSTQKLRKKTLFIANLRWWNGHKSGFLRFYLRYMIPHLMIGTERKVYIFFLTNFSCKRA